MLLCYDSINTEGQSVKFYKNVLLKNLWNATVKKIKSMYVLIVIKSCKYLYEQVYNNHYITSYTGYMMCVIDHVLFMPWNAWYCPRALWSEMYWGIVNVMVHDDTRRNQVIYHFLILLQTTSIILSPDQTASRFHSFYSKKKKRFTPCIVFMDTKWMRIVVAHGAVFV